MHDSGPAGGEVPIPALVLLSDQIEYRSQFNKRFFPRWHQRMASGNRWDLGHPPFRLVAVEHDFVVIECHWLYSAVTGTPRFRVRSGPHTHSNRMSPGSMPRAAHQSR